MRQALIFSLLSCTLISAAPAVAGERAARHPPFDWVLLDGDSNNMNGSMDALQKARALQQRQGEPLLYVSRGDRAWVIRDHAVLEKARASWAPAQELGKKMEALGQKMSAVGEVQRSLGDKMGLIGKKMGKIGNELGRMSPDDPARERLHGELQSLQREMDPLQVEMARLNREMQPFSDEMRRHGKEMQRLSEKAQAELAQIIEDALARGLAQEVR